MPLSSCDEDRLKIAELAIKNLDLARILVKEGKQEQALEAYLFAFDNSLYVSGWGGVRLSYIPGEIAALGKTYLPAINALEVRRDAREKLILAGETDYEVMAEWLSINRYLQDNRRELVVLNSLKKLGKVDKTIAERIIYSNYEYLLEQREYALLGEYLNYFGSMFISQIFHYETDTLLPAEHPNWDVERVSEGWLRRIRKQGTMLFELSLGTGREDIADEVSKRILLHCNDADSFNALVIAARRAGCKKKAKSLLSIAKSSLSPGQKVLLTD